MARVLENCLSRCKEMKILWISRPIHNRYHSMERFANHFCKTTGGDNIWKGDITHDEINEKYDGVIVSWMANYRNVKWDKVNIPKFAFREDLHIDINATTGKNAVAAESLRIVFNHFDYFITRYRDAWYKRYPDIPVFWSPHCIDPNIYKDWGMKKKYNVLISGKLGKGEYYGLRNKLAVQLKGIPSYHRPSGIFHREEYGKLLNGSHICVNCTTINKYPVAKTFEIPGSKSILLSDLLPEMKDIGFEDGETMIEYGKGIIEKVRHHIKNRDKMLKIQENAYEMAHKHHTIENRTNEMIEYLKDKV